MVSLLTSWRENMRRMVSVLTPGFSVVLLALLGLLGVASAYGQEVLLAVMLMLPAIPLMIAFPQVLMVLFMNAGIFKADPQIRALTMGIDLTLLTAGGLIAILAFYMLSRRVRIKWSREVTASLVFLAIVLISLIYAPPNSYGTPRVLQFASLTMLAFAAPLVLIRTPHDARVLLVVWIAVGMLLAVTTLSQPHTMQRVSAFHASAIGVSRVIGMAILCLIFMVMLGDVPWAAKAASGGLAFVLLVAMLSTGSRGPMVFAIVAFLLTLALSTGISRHRGQTIVIAVLGVVLMSVSAASSLIPQEARARFLMLMSDTEADTSAMAREAVWRDALDLFASHPLIGAGAGAISRYGAGQEQVYAHNLLLEVAAEQGLIGLIALVAFLALSFQRLLRAILDAGTARRDLPLLLAIFAMLIYMLSASLVSGDLNDAREAWMLIGIIVALTAPETAKWPSEGRQP